MTPSLFRFLNIPAAVTATAAFGAPAGSDVLDHLNLDLDLDLGVSGIRLKLKKMEQAPKAHLFAGVTKLLSKPTEEFYWHSFDELWVKDVLRVINIRRERNWGVFEVTRIQGSFTAAEKQPKDVKDLATKVPSEPAFSSLWIKDLQEWKQDEIDTEHKDLSAQIAKQQALALAAQAEAGAQFQFEGNLNLDPNLHQEEKDMSQINQNDQINQNEQIDIMPNENPKPSLQFGFFVSDDGAWVYAGQWDPVKNTAQGWGTLVWRDLVRHAASEAVEEYPRFYQHCTRTTLRKLENTQEVANRVQDFAKSLPTNPWEYKKVLDEEALKSFFPRIGQRTYTGSWVDGKAHGAWGLAMWTQGAHMSKDVWEEELRRPQNEGNRIREIHGMVTIGSTIYGEDMEDAAAPLPAQYAGPWKNGLPDTSEAAPHSLSGKKTWPDGGRIKCDGWKAGLPHGQNCTKWFGVKRGREMHIANGEYTDGVLTRGTMYNPNIPKQTREAKEMRRVLVQKLDEQGLAKDFNESLGVNLTEVVADEDKGKKSAISKDVNKFFFQLGKWLDKHTAKSVLTRRGHQHFCGVRADAVQLFPRVFESLKVDPRHFNSKFRWCDHSLQTVQPQWAFYTGGFMSEEAGPGWEEVDAFGSYNDAFGERWRFHGPGGTLFFENGERFHGTFESPSSKIKEGVFFGNNGIKVQGTWTNMGPGGSRHTTKLTNHEIKLEKIVITKEVDNWNNGDVLMESAYFSGQ